MAEIWKDIEGYEGLYQVSSFGRVRSLPKLGHHKDNIILHNNEDEDGYFIVTLCKQGVHKTKTVHRLVALSFIKNPENKPVVNHKDGNKQNNNVENLEWATVSENTLHAFRTGLVDLEAHAANSSKPVRCIETGQTFKSITSAAWFYRVKINVVFELVAGKTKNSRKLPGKHFEYVSKD